MDIALPKDFKEFLQLLDANGVEYLVIGGYAVSYHGYPRATDDLDVWTAVSFRVFSHLAFPSKSEVCLESN